MVRPDPRRRLLATTCDGGQCETNWKPVPWVMPANCVLWWQHATGWQVGPSHVLESDLPIGEVKDEPVRPRFEPRTPSR